MLPSSLAHHFASPWPLPRRPLPTKKAGAPVRNTRLKNKIQKNGSHLLSRIALQYHRRKRA